MPLVCREPGGGEGKLRTIFFVGICQGSPKPEEYRAGTKVFSSLRNKAVLEFLANIALPISEINNFLMFLRVWGKNRSDFRILCDFLRRLDRFF